jgi:hypothetical protein
MTVEIKIERFAFYGQGMEPDNEGEYVRFDDMLAGFRGIMAMLTEANQTAMNHESRSAFDEGYEAGLRDTEASNRG